MRIDETKERVIQVVPATYESKTMLLTNKGRIFKWHTRYDDKLRPVAEGWAEIALPDFEEKE